MQPRPRHGELFAPEFGSAREHWERRFADVVGFCRDVFDSGEIERFEQLGARLLDSFDVDIKPRLVHNDYHFGNLLHDGHDIVGILDFEWAMASDPAVDRVAWSQMDEYAPGALPDFVAGYRAEFGDFDDPLERRALYRIARNLELCDVAFQHFSVEEIARYKSTTLESLRRFEQTCGADAGVL